MTKTGKDFSNSADIKNPKEVKLLLDELHTEQASLEEMQGKIPIKLTEAISKQKDAISLILQKVKETIIEHGSYQDIETGSYGVRYGRKIKSYHTEPFKERFPKLIDAVIEEAVNVKALEGLLKGGLIQQDELLKPLMVYGQPVITEKISYAFYVR